MISYSGHLRKMQVQYNGPDTPVEYCLNLYDEQGRLSHGEIALNPLLGKKLSFHYKQEIHCLACSRKTSKSFNQGHCYPCFTRLASCDKCIMSPEKCHYDQGTCREPQWGLDNCMQKHFVYLANSSGIKVGITRGSQIPTRWVDQGAVQALPVFQVSTRYYSGPVEVLYKQQVSDRTQWQRMLKGPAEPIDLKQKQAELYQLLAPQVDELIAGLGDIPEDAIVHLDNNEMVEIQYPVLEYPTKVKSFNLDKQPFFEGVLLGIKGQYLILDTGVINIRKFSGYHIELETE